jgi:EAL domain-containing protein (putative c-di-GMP-specific phosphodiesterase class I)
MGGDRIEVFKPAMRARKSDRLTLESELRRALARDEITLLYQPIVRLEDRSIAGFEALMRWHHPKLGRLPPAEFISIAEETGLIVDLGRQVLRDACRVVASWAHDGVEGFTMSVNLSVRELENPDLVAEVRAEMERHQVSPSSFVIELTESALMRDVAVMTERLVALRELGVRIAIDDFGTGYSSLSRLRWLPIDILKIDRSFVDLVDTDPHSHAMLSAVLQLAAALDLQVVVEGVERRSQQAALSDLGCRWAQGFLFSPAVPAAALRPMVAGPARRSLPRSVRASVG